MQEAQNLGFKREWQVSGGDFWAIFQFAYRNEMVEAEPAARVTDQSHRPESPTRVTDQSHRPESPTRVTDQSHRPESPTRVT
ncbi:MAG: hypothetical protein RBQ99_04210, partial [Trichlorobacter sp.]|nr:hypothetical protein [Trichlorobacter sp.]